jgi:ribonuclease HI
MTDKVIIYTDGVCKGNNKGKCKGEGIGGWGFWLQDKDEERELCGGELQSTNNRMELMAAIKALESLPAKSNIKLNTDSAYVRNGITEWIIRWKKNGWKNSNKKPVENKDLWQRLDEVTQCCQVSWEADNSGNERAKRLANQGVLKMENKK